MWAPMCLLWLLLIATYDFRQRRVPNWLVLVGASGALAALAFGVQPFEVPWSSALLGSSVGFAVLLVFYVVHLLGAGDVKFAAALGLWVGLSAIAQIWLVASLIAGVHSLLWLALRRWHFAPRLALILSAPPSSPTRARFIPYAAYLALAAVAWMAWGRPS